MMVNLKFPKGGKLDLFIHESCQKSFNAGYERGFADGQKNFDNSGFIKSKAWFTSANLQMR
jgi:hypothetical protein